MLHHRQVKASTPSAVWSLPSLLRGPGLILVVRVEVVKHNSTFLSLFYLNKTNRLVNMKLNQGEKNEASVCP